MRCWYYGDHYHLVVEQDAHGAPRALSTTMYVMATSSMARLFTSGNRPLEQMSQIRTRRSHDHPHDQGEHHDLARRSQVRRPDRRVRSPDRGVRSPDPEVQMTRSRGPDDLIPFKSSPESGPMGSNQGPDLRSRGPGGQIQRSR